LDSPKKKPLQKPFATSVQLPKALEDRVKQAREMTGESQSALIVQCVERALDAVVKDIMDRQREKAMRFFEGDK
jgi:predicted DNA-binding protein